MAGEQDAKKDNKDKEEPKDKAKETSKGEPKKGDGDEEGSKELSTKKIIMLMSAAFAVILIITVVLLIMFLKPEAKASATHAESAEHGEKAPAHTDTEEKIAGDANKAAPVMQVQFIKIEPSFVVNFANTQNIKFLEVAVTLVTKTDREADLIKNNLPFIKDQLVTLFSAQKYDDIKAQQGRDLLRAQALTIVQQILEKQTNEKCVSDILFTSFVMQ